MTETFSGISTQPFFFIIIFKLAIEINSQLPVPEINIKRMLPDDPVN